MLRGVNDGVLDPEPLDAIDDDARPNFAKSFDESERAYVINGDVLQNFRERAELAPFPRGEGGSFLPEDGEMIIESAEVKGGKGCNHVVCETGGTRRGLSWHGFQCIEEVCICGGGAKVLKVREDGRVRVQTCGGECLERCLQTCPDSNE